MRIAIALVLVGVGTVVFHFLSPWWWTPIASNWGFIDQTIIITFWITGVVFIAVILFIAWCTYKYRARDGHRAEYEPESKKLEIWLTVGTAIGVIALLTPGLFAWADFVTVPDDAAEIEVLGQQWQWSFRYPGEDGILGTTDIANVSGSNPFGLHADDPNGQDDVLIVGNEIHLPLGQPLKVLLRSKDVLHNFYVPEFRAKMDMVPGMVTYFWFTPIRTGEFDIICAELCGIAHYAMRGRAIVDEVEDFEAWLAEQPTFAETQASGGATDVTALGDPVAAGQRIAQSQGCIACHTLDGSAGVGPTWLGLFGKTETLDDGSTVEVDAAYLLESIIEPSAKIVEGFPPAMPAYDLGDANNDALLAYIESLAP
ncbi:MAG: cytochrome c oxidase subunit II [Alphaproteobacteria bacterium]|nr:cytochrome c oxidase subunit II [Alphaproteobacteria bacterium]